MTVVQQSTTPEQSINSVEMNGEDSVAQHTLAAHEEEEATGSYNHSMIQTNVGFLLKQLGVYSDFTELSLDTSSVQLDNVPKRNEMQPDICIYHKRKLSRPFDILQMVGMPLLAVEILSPKQGIQEILEKFAVYFALGVKSCWLVDPMTAVVAVYSSLEQRTVYSTDKVIDEQLEIRLPFAEIFE